MDLKIKIVYFANLNFPNWQAIVLEQLNSLKLLDLYNISQIYMSVIANDLELNELKYILYNQFDKIQIYNSYTENLYEYPGIKSLYELSENDDNTIILYFHSKGMMAGQHLERQLLFTHTIQNYENYVTQFKNDNELDVAGAIPSAHGFVYFNFFWARSSYIYNYCSKPLLDKSYLKYDRFSWEMWLGNHFSKKRFIKTYSPLINSKYVFDEFGAIQIMNMLKINDITGLSNINEFNYKDMNQIALHDYTDKNTWHTYFSTYEKLFKNKRYNLNKLLEIGVYNGGSIQLWRDYFINGHIYGVDITDVNIKVDQILNDPDHITLFLHSNAYDSIFINDNFKNLKFDIIIDDGPHSLTSQVECIIKYIELLSDDGILVIEDIQNINHIQILSNYVPEKYKQFIQVYDLRNNINSYNEHRWDDILFVINKS